MSVPEPSFVLRCRESPVNALCPLSGGEQIILGHTDGSLSLWSFATRRKCGGPIPAHSKAVLEVAAAEGIVISQGRDGRVLGWRRDSAGLQEKHLLASCSEASFCRIQMWAALNEPLSWRIAFVAPNDAICVLCVSPRPAASPCASVAPSRDLGSCMALANLPSARLAAGFESGHVALFCIENAAELCCLRPFEEPVMALGAPPSAPRFCAASVGRRILFFDLQEAGDVTNSGAAAVTLREARTCDVTNPGLAAVTWREDGRMLALCGWDRRVRLMTRGGKLLAVLSEHRSRLVGAKFTARGRLCVSDESGVTSVWDLYPTD